MISLNGIAIPHYTLDQLRWVHKRIPTEELILWDKSYGRQAFNLMLPPRVPQPPVRIGVLHWPQGASRWASFHAVLTEDQLSQIDPQYPGVASTYVSGSSADTLCNDREWVLVLDDGNPGNKITTTLHPFSPVPLQDISGKIKYYLVTLVDERFYWWWRAGQVTITEGVTTWSNVFTQASSVLEISPSVDFIDPALDRPTRLMGSNFLPAPLVLDAAAWACGMRVVRLFDGSVEIQTPENGKAIYDTAVAAWDAQRLAGGQSTQGYLVWDVPEKICVAFNKVSAGQIITGQYAVTIDLNDTAIPEFATVGGRCGTLPVFAQLLASVAADGSGTPSNLSTLTAYAKKWAERYYRWYLRRPNLHYAGVVPFQPTGLVDATEVHHHAENRQFDPLRNPGGHRVTTRLLPVPWDWRETGAPASVTPGSTSGFWARLTAKTYPMFGDIEYQFTPVADSDDPTPITWTDGPISGSVAYEANNNDLPVSPSSDGIYSGSVDDRPTIVWMRQGTGNYYLFASEPREDIVEIFGGSGGFYTGAMMAYDDASGTLFEYEPVNIIDVNALP